MTRAFGDSRAFREIAFIDPGVSDIATLLAGLRPEIAAIRLDPAQSVRAQIARALAFRPDLDQGGLEAIHIIAHGAPGRVRFAAEEWSLATLDGTPGDPNPRDAGAGAAEGDACDLAAIGRALGPTNGEPWGELCLWSCDTAAGVDGAVFVASLAQATGAAIAAAEDRIGAAAMGGSWDLAARSGLSARPPLTEAGVSAYAGVLAGVYRIISGDVPHDPAENVAYVVVNSRDKRVVATFSLPGHANIPKFSITVTVPSGTETYEAGRLDENGKFIPANFIISETSPLSTGSMNAGGARHGA